MKFVAKRAVQALGGALASLALISCGGGGSAGAVSATPTSTTGGTAVESSILATSTTPVAVSAGSTVAADAAKAISAATTTTVAAAGASDTWTVVSSTAGYGVGATYAWGDDACNAVSGGWAGTGFHLVSGSCVENAQGTELTYQYAVDGSEVAFDTVVATRSASGTSGDDGTWTFCANERDRCACDSASCIRQRRAAEPVRGDGARKDARAKQLTTL